MKEFVIQLVAATQIKDMQHEVAAEFIGQSVNSKNHKTGRETYSVLVQF